MSSVEYIKSEYPLHWFCWHNLHQELDSALAENSFDKEKRDPRGRTPLMLSVTLGHLESTKILLQHDADVRTENADGWSVLQEAISNGNRELVKIVLERRDFQKYSTHLESIPEILKRLNEAPDFYVEMKWEFTSWVPLVSRMCPSDTYKIFKKGANVRVDATLLGFEHGKWQRGNRSYVFKGLEDGALMMEVDHDAQEVYVEEMRMCSPEDLPFFQSEDYLQSKLTSPIVITYVDTHKINFERTKSGVWGWRSDKTECVNGCHCKVFSATNVEIVTKTRTEHLSEADKIRAKASKKPLQAILGNSEIERNSTIPDVTNRLHDPSSNPYNIMPEEYFDKDLDLQGKDIGKRKEISTKVQKFKAMLWLCEDYPLSLREQILPIVDIMATSSSHFTKLKEFIQMQIPSGFPVKIEIPLFHVLNAKITFGNIFALDEDVEGVTRATSGTQLKCVTQDRMFDPPETYKKVGNESHQTYRMEDDEILQYAIEQSLLEYESNAEEQNLWEAVRARQASRLREISDEEAEEKDLQRAIQESLYIFERDRATSSITVTNIPSSVLEQDEDMAFALQISEKNRQEEELLRQQEEQVIEDVLRMSLEDK